MAAIGKGIQQAHRLLSMGGEHGVESTIAVFENNRLVIFRLGAIITPEEVEEVAEEVKVHKQTGSRPLSPGMLPYHYSPGTPFTQQTKLRIYWKSMALHKRIITFYKTMENLPQEHLAVLSPTANMSQAASSLYHSLHRLDGRNLKRIIAERLPKKGLGNAITERMKKAAVRLVAES